MVRNLSKLSILFSISFLLIPCIPQPMMGCGGGDPIDIIEMSLFSPEIISSSQFEPFFLTYENYYGYNDGERSQSNESTNTSEWENYFDHLIPKESVQNLVHKSTIEHLDSLILMTKGKMNPGISVYTKLINSKKYNSGLSYLRKAKEVEHAFTYDYYSWNPAPLDTIRQKTILPELVKGWKEEKDIRIKNRYAFQVIRVNYLLGNYADGVKFYEQQVKMEPADGSMFYRTLGYKAACLYKLHRYAESNFIYARIYDEYEPHRIDAFTSFHPLEEADWNALMAMAKTTREKCLLWHLFGVYADPLKGMREIIALDPSSNLLDLLLVRSVNLAEMRLLKNVPAMSEYDYLYSDYSGEETISNDAFNSWKSIDSTRATTELLDFVENTARNLPVRKDVWGTSAAYLNWLANKPAACDEWISKTEKGAEGIIARQLFIIKALRMVESIDQMRVEDENKVMQNLQVISTYGLDGFPLRSEATKRYIRNVMSRIYTRMNDPLMAELSETNYYQFLNDSAQVQLMIDFMKRPDKRPIQNYLLGSYPVKIQELYEVQAVGQMYKYNFDLAIKSFAKDSTSGLTELLGNPFNMGITDCHDCDHQKFQKVKYTKSSFARKMLEMKNKTQTSKDSQEKANNAFLYANGLYNMTWYGNARLVSSTVVNWDYIDTYHLNSYDDKPRNKSPYYDCAEAQRWYLKAMAWSSNKEFKAKCAWMAAKCEHNMWLEGEYNLMNTEGEEEQGDFKSGIYFNLMKANFSDTQYYKDVIQECGYFCTYLNPEDKSCIRNK